MKYLVYLDSRASIGPRPSNCSFNLNQPIVNGSRVRVVSFSFANTLYNVDSSNNTLTFSTFTLTIPVGYYTAQNLVDYINTACLANGAFAGATPNPPSSPCITWDTQTVQFAIGSNILYPCSAFAIFQLDPTNSGGYMENFHCNMFLASPWAIALNSPSLVGNETRFISCNRITSPFYVQHIESGFGEIETANNSLQMNYSATLSHANISQLGVIVSDPYSNRELEEISAWSCILEISV